MAGDKLIFPIGFDLEGGVKEASKEWKNTYQKQLQKAIDDKPLKVKIDFESKGVDPKEFKQWMALSREAEKLERERIKNAKEWQKVADQAAMAETRRANATNESNARIERANRKVEASERRRTESVERTTSAYRNQSTYLSRLIQRMVAYASVTQAFSFIRNIREVTAQFELQRVALGSIIGDLNEANAMFEQIKAAAVKSPFEIKDLVSYTKQLAAYKIETDELFETTQKLADVSAGLGVGMERLVLAYGQIRATGYLRASEVRQLNEAGIPIVEELAKKMSDLRGETVSAAEVMGMISERAISFGMVKEVFDDMTSAGGMFYKMQEKQAETLQGQWSNLKDSIAIMYDEIGNTESVNNAMKEMIGLIKSLAENWRDVYSIAQSLSVAMGVYYVATKNATVASKALSVAEATRLSTLRATTIYMPKFLASTKLAITLTRAYRVATIKSATATGLLSKAFWGLTKAMLSNPYTAVLAALAGITFAIVKFATKTKTTQERIDDLNKSVASPADLKDDVKPLVDELDALSQKANKTAEEQKRLNQVTQELARIYPEAIVGVRKFGSEVELSAEKVKELYEAERQAIEEGLKIKLQANEDKLKKEEERLSRLDKALVDKTYTETTYGFGGSSTTTTYKYTTEELEDLAEQADESREKIAFLNNSIKEGRIALGLQKSDLEAATDTFNTWQKELASITSGKNLKGEEIRLFDDESITQINKLTDATTRVAEEYKKLAKEKESVDKALKSEGAKADEETYAQLDTRLTRINKSMSMLYDFLKKYGGLDLLSKNDSSPQDNRLANLKEEVRLLEKIYAKYKEYRKYMSEQEAKDKIQTYFGDTIKSLRFGVAYDDLDMKDILGLYQEAARKLPKSDKDVLELGFKIEDIDWQSTKSSIEKNLKKLSDDLSRTKTAKEFFDRMLGLTGDKQLSATLTMSVYGMEADKLDDSMFQTLKEQAMQVFQGVDISSAFNDATKNIDYTALDKLVDSVDEGYRDKAQDFVDSGMKSNASWLEDLQKTYQKAFTFEERRTQVMEQEAQKRKEIEDSNLPQEQKEQFKKASAKRESEQLSAINLEEFKASDDYLKIFEELDRLATPTIQRLIDKLREFIAANKELSATDLKNLTEQINKMEEGLIQRTPFVGLIKSIDKLRIARQKLQASSFEDDKQYTDALDDQNEAYDDMGKALEAIKDEFSEAERYIRDFASALGLPEDSDLSVFLNGVADSFGVVQKAIIFATFAMKLFDGTVKTFLATNPLGWIALVASAIVGAIKMIMNIKVRRAERQIEDLNARLESLEYSYERLEKAQEKAFGTDYIRNYTQQLENLTAQQEAYLKQAEAERSKGKKADKDKIKDYEEQARDTADAISDMYGSLSENFLGQDLTSAARDFAQAWIEAYKEFANTTDAMKEKFQEMVQNMIVESLLARVMERALKPIFDAIDSMQETDFYSTSFWQNLMHKMDEATTNGVIGAENVMSMLEQLGINMRDLGGDMTGISRDIATASEESILGLAASINTQNFYISQVPPKLDTIIALLRGEGGLPQGSAMTLQDLVTIQNQHLSYLPSIAQHTADTVAECKAIVVETRRTADALERVIKPRGTQSTHTMNTTLN